jgi:Protein of unknown function (DUF1569)
MKTLARHEDKAELLTRLRLVRPDSPRHWGKMSAHQMVCHLSDAFRMAVGEQAVTDRSGLFQRTIIKNVALYVPFRWPAGVPTSPELDQLRDGGTRPSDFAIDVLEVEATMERMATESPTFAWPTHPIFGRLSRAEWMRWGYLHTDHHLRQFGL